MNENQPEEEYKKLLNKTLSDLTESGKIQLTIIRMQGERIAALEKKVDQFPIKNPIIARIADYFLN